MTEEILELLDDLENAPARIREPAEARARLGWLDRANALEIAAFFGKLPDIVPAWSTEADALLGDVIARLARRLDVDSLEGETGWLPLWNVLLSLPLGTGDRPRAQFLILLAKATTDRAIETLVDLLLTNEKIPSNDAVLSLASLVQSERPVATKIFPRMLDGLAKPELAPAVLDLANYWTRRGDLAPHPAAHLAGNLAGLLSSVVNGLERLHESPMSGRSNEKEVAETIGRAVGLGVALCDALGLIGDPQAAGKALHKALDLPHRRLKTEAAGALARLGVEEGKAELVKLAAEPVARLRVLAYAGELGLSGRIPPEFASDEARAEAELAVWLSDPLQFGLPPNRCELLDNREQYWPGYETPVRCYLFRFEYEFATAQGLARYANVGIVGPLVHAVMADVLDLPPDDLYALFAGWNTEHEDIFEVDFAMLNEAQRVDVARLERRLKDDQFDQIRPKMLCSFFGEKSLAAVCKKGTADGVVVVDNDQILWYPAAQGNRSLGVPEAIWIHRGRRMLREFNP